MGEEAERDAHGGNYSEDTLISTQRWQIDSSDVKRSSSITEHGQKSDQSGETLFQYERQETANS